eukprot:TRINITY_DN15939_c0_g1_i1.p1 TRINITY_DN15939_c0_g1~~TRINITY_DN15939_c0_g1_i1.p1  ORF type:complete len:233 (-),score=7.77 TRINITY_DN15939_c0_g1_i1:76-774(-)
MLSELQRLSALFGALSIVGYLYFTLNDDIFYRQWTKPWPMVALILYSLGGFKSYGRRYNFSIIIAQIFCLAGDIFLEMRDMFLPGLIAFFIGHIVYIYAFALVGVLERKLFYLPFVGYGLAFWWYLLDNLDDLSIPVLLYAGILAFMTAGSFSTWDIVKRQHGSLAAALIPVGAILFVISDSVLAVHKFVDSSNTNLRYINIITYWGAQWLLTYGSLYVGDVLPRPARLKMI